MADRQTTFPLPQGALSMCAYCMKNAAYFVIHIPTHGTLVAVCEGHAKSQGDL